MTPPVTTDVANKKSDLRLPAVTDREFPHAFEVLAVALPVGCLAEGLDGAAEGVAVV
ncbi:hypothetical protein ACFSBJ_12465 [Haloplanus ruber]|uniref:Uncharacterized protein n=1 Tax=Haloplanus ruber TaxID=869892 RepID=A0ABD6CZA4_9EURY